MHYLSSFFVRDVLYFHDIGPRVAE